VKTKSQTNTPKKLEAPESPTFDVLLEVVQTLSYVGQSLANTQIPGYDALKHHNALTHLHALFVAADAAVKAHPEYAQRLKAQNDERLAQQRAEKARDKRFKPSFLDDNEEVAT
jgi:hypothetical protein